MLLSEIPPIGRSGPIQKQTQKPTRPIKQPYRVRTDAKYICPLPSRLNLGMHTVGLQQFQPVQPFSIILVVQKNLYHLDFIPKTKERGRKTSRKMKLIMIFRSFPSRLLGRDFSTDFKNQSKLSNCYLGHRRAPGRGPVKPMSIT